MLFEDSDDASDDENETDLIGDKLKVNQNYAQRFEKRKKQQELARLREKLDHGVDGEVFPCYYTHAARLSEPPAPRDRLALCSIVLSRL